MEIVTEIVITGLGVGTPMQNWAMLPGAGRMLVKYPSGFWDFLPNNTRAWLDISMHESDTA